MKNSRPSRQNGRKIDSCDAEAGGPFYNFKLPIYSKKRLSITLNPNMSVYDKSDNTALINESFRTSEHLNDQTIMTVRMDPTDSPDNHSSVLLEPKEYQPDVKLKSSEMTLGHLLLADDEKVINIPPQAIVPAKET